MSVKVTYPEDGKANIELSNGHAEALKKIQDDYQIVDAEKTVGFILSVMRDADGKAVETINGSFIPTPQIVKNQDDNSSNENGDQSTETE